MTLNKDLNMAVGTNTAHPFPQVTGPVLIQGEAEGERPHQAMLMSSKSTGTNNPPITNTITNNTLKNSNQSTLALTSEDSGGRFLTHL